MELEYRVEHRNVKHPRIEFKGIELVIIAPLNMNNPEQIIKEKRNWIDKRWRIIINTIRELNHPGIFMIFGEIYKIERSAAFDKPLIDHDKKLIRINSKTIMKQLKIILEEKVREIVKEYTDKLKVKPNKINIKRQKTRWGSCSNKGNINLNLKLVCLPEELLRYIVYHELTHIKHKRHDKNFWMKIETEFPKYKEYRNKLMEYWFKTEVLFKGLENSKHVN